jgi:hypothetical protein
MAKPAVSADIGRGATILTAYAARQVKAYPIFETELDSISFLNTQATIYFSLASALFSFAVGILTNAAFVDTMTAPGAILAKVIAPLLIVGAICAGLLGRHAFKSRASQWSKIRHESTGGFEAATPA